MSRRAWLPMLGVLLVTALVLRTTFFVGKETLITAREGVGMPLWRDRLFAYMARNARSATSFFRLPSTQVVELGAQIEI